MPSKSFNTTVSYSKRKDGRRHETKEGWNFLYDGMKLFFDFVSKLSRLPSRVIRILFKRFRLLTFGKNSIYFRNTNFTIRRKRPDVVLSKIYFFCPATTLINVDDETPNVVRSLNSYS